MMKSLACKLSILLVVTMIFSLFPTASFAEKFDTNSVKVSSFTDVMGSININAGKGEGITTGMKGIILRDGKQIADYEVMQVNWGISRINVTNLLDGYKVTAGDSAPLTSKIIPQKKSSNKTWKTVAIAAVVIAAACLIGGSSSGGGSGSDTRINSLTVTNTGTVTPDGKTLSFTIEADISKSNGDPVASGTAVTFSISPHVGTLSPTSTTVSSGKATATLTYDSTTDAAVDSAVITVKCDGQSKTATVSFVSKMSITASEDTISIYGSGGTPDSSLITVNCYDAYGNPATSGTVTFTANNGTFDDSTATIQADGTATATYTSTTSGEDTITATWSKSTATAKITVNAGPPATISNLTASPSSIKCTGNSYSTITATVKDAGNNPVTKNTVVDFTVTADNSGGGNGTFTGQVTTIQAMTNSSGVATAYLYSKDTTGATSAIGTAKVTAQVLKASQTTAPEPVNDLSSDTTVQFTAASIPASIVLSANPTSIRGWDQSSNSTTVTATVKNASGNPVDQGTTVYFTTDHGSITASSTTDSTGKATATLYGDGTSNAAWNGVTTVTANSGTVNGTTTVLFTGGPVEANSTVALSRSTPVTISAGEGLTITLTIKDANNNLVANGMTVTATTDKGSITSSTTTSNGIAVLSLTTSNNVDEPTPAGTGTITITVDTVQFAPITFTVN